MKTAWFGSDHPASDEWCPKCKAPPGARCIRSNTFPWQPAVQLTGMHSERVSLTLPTAKAA